MGSDGLVTLTFPRTVAADLLKSSLPMLRRMHELLERNANRELSPDDRAQLEALVRIAHVEQVLAASLEGQIS